MQHAHRLKMNQRHDRLVGSYRTCLRLSVCERKYERYSAVGSFSRRQRCIIPAELIDAPRHAGTVDHPGPSERCRIQLQGTVPMGVADVYRGYVHPGTGGSSTGCQCRPSNVDDHPVYRQLHRPGDEERMPVILARDDYTTWLTCSPQQARAMCRPWLGPLEVRSPALAPPRAAKRRGPPADNPQADLLGGA